VLFRSHRLALRVSIGAACQPALDHSDPDSLLIEADRALYRAKHGGRDRLCMGDAPEPLSGVEVHEPVPASVGTEAGLGRVIVVDNDSRDGTVSAVRDAYPAITIIANLFLSDANSIVNADSGSGVNGTVTIQSPNAPISGQIQPLGKTPLRCDAS
jgi:hypothetical protein